MNMSKKHSEKIIKKHKEILTHLMSVTPSTLKRISEKIFKKKLSLNNLYHSSRNKPTKLGSKI